MNVITRPEALLDSVQKILNGVQPENPVGWSCKVIARGKSILVHYVLSLDGANDLPISFKFSESINQAHDALSLAGYEVTNTFSSDNETLIVREKNDGWGF